MSDIDALLDQYRSENKLSSNNYQSTNSASTTPPPILTNTTTSPLMVFGWTAFALLYIIAIIALVVAVLAYEKVYLTPGQQLELQELTDNVAFDGKILVAAGFSDAFPPSNSETNLLISGGAMEIQTMAASGQVTANVFVAASGLTVQTGDITASESKVTCHSVATNLVNLKQSTKNISITPNLLTIGDTASLATLNLQSSSLSLTNSNGRTTSMTANGVFVPNQNLMGLRYLANGMDIKVESQLADYQLIAPVAAENVYGSLFIAPSELSLPATFEICFAGTFLNDSGADEKTKIALVNGSEYDNTQCFLGSTTDVFSSNLGGTIVVGGCAFEGKYTVTFLSFGLGTTECFSTGSVSYGYSTAPSIITTLNSTVSTIDSTFGITFSLWAIWSVASADVTMTLKYLSLKQIISVPV